jgi:curved DNA-binding protein CbpA
MVKADIDRDYYADLEVQPTASDEDIKRAFRNLGTFFRQIE